MPGTAYLLAAVAIVFAITLGLRALPFTVLAPLRRSALVRDLATWMPAGIVAILAASLLLSSAGAGAGSGAGPGGGHALPALIAVAVTVAVHLLLGRRTLISVAAGTLVFVVLVNVG